MSHSTLKMLSDLEARFASGAILERDYRVLRYNILKDLKDQGIALPGDVLSVPVSEETDSLGTLYCKVDDGSFIFGPDDGFGECLAPFYIAKFPVTVADFMEFLEDTDYEYPPEDLEKMQLASPEPDCPATNISYVDAKEYCRWLRTRTQEYYSLPHELEWEKAARGIDGRLYPWGSDQLNDELACFQGDLIYNSTVPVGSYEGNISVYGCVDMVGNIWEWCLDSFDDPRDPHIMRGGAWCNTAEFSNCVSRTFVYPPEKRMTHVGFRVVYLPHEMFVEYRRKYAGGTRAGRGQLKVYKMEKADVEQHKAKMKSGSASERLAAAMAEAVQRAASNDGGTEPAEETQSKLLRRPDQDFSPRPRGPADRTPLPEEPLLDDDDEPEDLGKASDTVMSEGPMPAEDSPEDLEMYDQMAQAISEAADQFLRGKDSPAPELPVSVVRPSGKKRTPASLEIIGTNEGADTGSSGFDLEFGADGDVPLADLGVSRGDAEAARRAAQRRLLEANPAAVWGAFGVWLAALLVVLSLLVLRVVSQ